jgi:hypothetical protein
LLSVLITLNQILMAGVAITAFSLLLYSLTFNLRERVARSFAIILVCLVIVFSAETLASVVLQPEQLDFWLRFQWIGIIILPTAYLHFSDALLATTGKPSRGRRRWAIRLSFGVSLLFLIALPLGLLVGPLVVDSPPVPRLQSTWFTDLFIIYFVTIMVMSWYNFVRAYNRSATATGRRRIGYLLVGAVAPALGSFPFLLFGSALAARHTLTFWSLSVLNNILVGGLVVMMAYSVAFFGVALPDRTVKSRLVKWILRGPVVASFTLAATTIVRRAGDLYGLEYNAFTPIVMAIMILLGEYLVTLFFPVFERWFLYGNDKDEIDILRHLEERLITRHDLRQFLEMALSAVCDRLQSPGAYLAALNPDGLELVVKVGKTFFDQDEVEEELNRLLGQNEQIMDMFRWGDDIIIPFMDENEDENPAVVGILGISRVAEKMFEEDQLQALSNLKDRISRALSDRRLQEGVFRTLNELSSKAEYIQQLRAAGRYDQRGIFDSEIPFDRGDITQWVKDALTHYWGGPKLTQSPLMRLRVVQETIERNNGNASNALRSILKEAIERVRPEGERRFTAEWVLYNILEMKFLEGKKVREIAMRLAMSEADLYRKQRVAIEAVAVAIVKMESENGRPIELQKEP